MREIKFRAWDKIDNRMITAKEQELGEYSDWPITLAVGFHGLPIAFDKDSFKENRITGWNRDHNLILMQFTGLLDKNGKEIWEGDRVKHDQFPTPLVVQWDWDQWGLFDNICNEASIGKDDVEVIGNIYESGS